MVMTDEKDCLNCQARWFSVGFGQQIVIEVDFKQFRRTKVDRIDLLIYIVHTVNNMVHMRDALTTGGSS